MDREGNVYVVGLITGTTALELGNGVAITGNSPKYWSPMLVKYNSRGDVLWARTVTGGGSDDSYFAAVVVDPAGNVYAAGRIAEGAFDFGDGVTAVGLPAGPAFTFNAILVKYGPEGRALWARTIEASSDWSQLNDVAVDSSGSVCCVGGIGRGVFSFGNGVSASGGPQTQESVIVLKYDSSGAIQWARSVPTGSGDAWGIKLSSVAVDAAGYVYAAGGISTETFDFGNGVTVTGRAGSRWEPSALMVKYDPSGTALWALPGPVGTYEYTSVAVDRADMVYAGGTVDSGIKATFGDGITVSAPGVGGQYNMLLVKYDSAGAVQWARSVTEAPDNSYVWSVQTDSARNVYVAGVVRGGGTFGFGMGVTARGPWSGLMGSKAEAPNAVLVKYDAAGTVQWAKAVAAASSDTAFRGGVAVDASGRIYAAGFKAGGAVSFDPGVSTPSGASEYWNGVLVRYSQ